MVNIYKTFYDKTCNIYRTTVVDKDGTQVPKVEAIYTNLSCDFYIAPRGNVINFIPGVDSRNTEKDRFDCLIPWNLYVLGNPITKGDSLEIINSDGVLEWNYVIDQMTIYRLPNGRIDNVYLRLNNDSKWKLP